MQRPNFEETNIFDQSAKEIAYTLYGTLWGDATYVARNTPFIKISHTAKQRQYVKFMKHLADYWGLKNTYSENTQNTTLGVFDYCNLNVWVTPPMRRQFEKFSRLINVNGKKIISSYAAARVTDLGLLLWWLDDGCLTVSKQKGASGNYSTRRFGRIFTNGFDYPSQQNAIKCLENRFGIQASCRLEKSAESSLGKGKSYYRLYLPHDQTKILIDRLAPFIPYIPNDMRYKFDLKYELSEPKSNIQTLVQHYDINRLSSSNVSRLSAEAHGILLG